MEDYTLESNLTNLLKEKKVTVTALAKMCGCSRQNMSEIKTAGRIPSLKTALRISQGLQTPIDRIWKLKRATS